MSSQFARLKGALDRVGTTTPGTIIPVFAEDLHSILAHYVDVVRESAERNIENAQLREQNDNVGAACAKLEQALAVALEAMGLVVADLVCEASHHKKKDRHEIGEPCPVEKRWHEAFAKLKEVRRD